MNAQKKHNYNLKFGLKITNRYFIFSSDPNVNLLSKFEPTVPTICCFNNSNVFCGKPKSRTLHPCGHNANHYYIQTSLPFLCHSAKKRRSQSHFLNQKSNNLFFMHPWPRSLQEIRPQLWMLAGNDKTQIELFASFFRAGWTRYRITTQKRTIRLWLTPCSPPWRDPVSVWTTHAPTSAAGPRTTKKSSMPVLSSRTAFSSQRAK